LDDALLRRYLHNHSSVMRNFERGRIGDGSHSTNDDGDDYKDDGTLEDGAHDEDTSTSPPTKDLRHNQRRYNFRPRPTKAMEH